MTDLAFPIRNPEESWTTEYDFEILKVSLQVSFFNEMFEWPQIKMRSIISRRHKRSIPSVDDLFFIYLFSFKQNP